jgi:bla regulator protein blaR1
LIATWMFWGIVAATGLGAIGLVAERGLVLLDRPTRWAWLLVMLTSVLWPFASIVSPVGPSAAVGMAAAPAGAVGPGVALAVEAAPAAPINARPDALLLGGWLGASAVLLVLLLATAVTLRADRRGWKRATVAGEAVLISGVQGPAVVGAVRPRIVIPGWVLELDDSVQSLIVGHEREHLRGEDSRLLVAALALLVILPWCVPLWWQFHRLRESIETDCDGRLLRSGAPAREYAEVLVAVAGRSRRGALPLAALSPSGMALERRIRRILVRPCAASRRVAMAIFAAALLSVPVAASVLPAPPTPAPTKLAVHLRGVHPDGTLPGDPGEARLEAAIRAHHADAVAAGLPEKSVIWFVADWRGAVVRTGIERGTESEVVARIRARYPDETSERVLAWSGVPAAGGGDTGVIWLVPEP